MSYLALYRKFRPQTFDQVKGQDHVVRTLKNQVKNERIGHAYLFTGTRGTGKTSIAKIFAKALNCVSPRDGEPCGECENCRAISAGNFVDVVEVDAASNNGVDDIRRIIDEIQYTPVKGKYKVFIIDEAHMITGPAFNAFLKTLEEPPAYAVFILATTEPHKLPITILSRCQRYDFRRITVDDISGYLKSITEKEGVDAEEKALRYIAAVGDGSMRDSISLLDKCIAFNLGEKLTYENVLSTLGVMDTEVFSRVYRLVSKGDAAGMLSEIENVVDEGKDLTQFAADFVGYIRNLLLLSAAPERSAEMLGISEANLARMKEDSTLANANTYIRYIRILSELINRMRFSTTKQILLETEFIKLSKPEMEEDVQSLADKIRQLEAKINERPVIYVGGESAGAASSVVNAGYDENAGSASFAGADDFAEEDEFEAGSAQIVYEPEGMQQCGEQPGEVQLNEMQQSEAPQSEVQPGAGFVNRESKETAKKSAVLDSWDEIIKSTGAVLKHSLMQSRVSGDDETITLTAKTKALANFLNDESKLSELKAVIKGVAGKEPAILIVSQGSEGPGKTAAARHDDFGEPTAVSRDEPGWTPAASKGEPGINDPVPNTERIDELLKNINFEIGMEEN